jgi:hypothetical protein
MALREHADDAGQCLLSRKSTDGVIRSGPERAVFAAAAAADRALRDADDKDLGRSGEDRYRHTFTSLPCPEILMFKRASGLAYVERQGS